METITSLSTNFEKKRKLFHPAEVASQSKDSESTIAPPAEVASKSKDSASTIAPHAEVASKSKDSASTIAPHAEVASKSEDSETDDVVRTTVPMYTDDPDDRLTQVNSLQLMDIPDPTKPGVYITILASAHKNSATTIHEVACENGETGMFTESPNKYILKYVYTIWGNAGPVNRVIRHPTHPILVTCGDHNQVIFYEFHYNDSKLSSRKICEINIENPVNYISSIAFNATGSCLAIASSDKKVRLYSVSSDCSSATYDKTLDGLTSNVVFLKFSPIDDKLLATAGRDSDVNLWDVESNTCLKTLTGHNGLVFSVDWHANGKNLATTGSDHKVILWDVELGKCVKILHGHTGHVSCVKFHTGENCLVSCGEDRSIIRWNLKTNESGKICGANRVTTYEGNRAYVWCIALHRTIDVIVSGDLDGNIKLWKINTREERLLTIVKEVDRHDSEINDVAVNERYVATAGFDKRVCISTNSGFEDKKLPVVLDHPEKVLSVDFHPTAPLLATGCDDKKWRIWRISDNGLSAICLATVGGYIGSVYCVKFDNNGDRLATTSRDGTIKIWSILFNELSNTCVVTCIATGVDIQHGQRRWIRNMAWHPINKSIIVTGSDNNPGNPWSSTPDSDNNPGKVWLIKPDNSSMKCVSTLNGHTWGGIWSVVFDRTGSVVITAGQDNAINLWSVSPDKLSATCVATLEGHNTHVKSLAMDRKGKYFASCSSNSISVWKLSPDKLSATCVATGNFDSEISSVTWDEENVPTGWQFLIVGTRNGKIYFIKVD